MIKKAEKEANPEDVPAPEFLQHCSKAGKRIRSSDGSMKTAFMPDWGICEQDAIKDSHLLAREWSRNAIAPADKVHFATATDLEENESMGAYHAYNVSRSPLPFHCYGCILAVVA